MSLEDERFGSEAHRAMMRDHNRRYEAFYGRPRVSERQSRQWLASALWEVRQEKKRRAEQEAARQQAGKTLAEFTKQQQEKALAMLAKKGK